MIRLQGVTRRFGEVTAVRELDLEVEQGEILALIGPSGSGKTTVLRMVAGFELPDAGRVALGGRLVAGAGRPVPPERRSAGLVFQHDACFPHLSVERNVTFGLRRSSRAERRRRAGQLLALVGLEGLGGRFPHELSGGQRQRVAIARALAPRPSVVLLDEPFAHLDTALRQGLRTDLRAALKEEAQTAMLVTHDRAEALSVADRVAVMSDGRLLQVGRPRESFHAPACPVAATILGEGALIPARARAGRLETEIGPLVPVRPVAEGAEVQVLLRPDDLDISPDPAGAATVRRASFLGGEVSYTLELASGVLVGGHGRHRDPLPEGTAVRVRPCAERFAWFPPPAPGAEARPAA
ncbi:MAG: ABC transporter ATP-binding protein [Thermoleophilia bacterium]|nr:ABC transporter ATP-binding protein [Thermoleophilia bacterium]